MRSILCVQFLMHAIVYGCCASMSKPWLLQTRSVIFGGHGETRCMVSILGKITILEFLDGQKHRQWGYFREGSQQSDTGGEPEQVNNRWKILTTPAFSEHADQHGNRDIPVAAVHGNTLLQYCLKSQFGP